jgi:hypothetical protein
VFCVAEYDYYYITKELNMPHFSNCCGKDEYVCQKCGKILCSECHPSEWRPDITGHQSAGNVCPECLKNFVPMPVHQKVTRSMIKDYVKNKIMNDERWLFKSLLTIYKYQTAEEKAVEHTRYHNCVGFTGTDAPFLSSLAVQLRDRGSLSVKQKIQLKKMMPKYWKQIVEVSDKEKLNEQVLKVQPVVQMELNI